MILVRLLADKYHLNSTLFDGHFVKLNIKPMKKVLLVEDDRLLAENIADILMLSGYIVCFVENGDKGQQSLFSYSPDIVISDVSMPGMNGLELVALMRREPLHRNIPVILLSGKITEHDVQRGKNAGANAYLQKPFDADELVKSVSMLLK
jgi:DNA-binding response OmpR family regulator